MYLGIGLAARPWPLPLAGNWILSLLLRAFLLFDSGACVGWILLLLKWRAGGSSPGLWGLIHYFQQMF